MKIAASYLSIKEDLSERIKMLDKSNIDYIHVDVMDGKFVPNVTRPIDDICSILKNTKKPKDVHLMVENVIEYSTMYAKLNPEFITFHLEATNHIKETIKYIKDMGIKVGISIKPNTPLDKLFPYLKMIDLVLIMSVEPGKGGQSFIPESSNRISDLKQIRHDKKCNFVIEVDGGINDETIKKVDVDIAVSGSFITNSDNYDTQIDKIKEAVV